MNQNPYPIIKCPHCQYNYAAAEVMHPSDFLGKPTAIIRDALGKLLYQEYEEGYEPSAPTSFICDSCDKQFIIEPVVNYRVRKEVKELDFSEVTASLLDE